MDDNLDIAKLSKILGAYIIGLIFTYAAIVAGYYNIVYPTLSLPSLVTTILGGGLLFASTLIGIQVGVPLVNGTTILTIQKAQNNIGTVSNSTPTNNATQATLANTQATLDNTQAMEKQNNG